MNNFYDHLNTAKQGIRMSAEAKQKGKEQLFHFIRAHEAIQPAAARGASWFGSHRLFVRVGTSFALLVIVGGSTSLAAASALPGDALYAVKLNVNEKIRSAVAVSPESEAKLDAELAAKRLDEASQLSIEGRMNVATEARIASNFEVFAERAEAKIEALKAAGKAEAAADVEARFESALNAHASILAKLEADGDVNVEPIRSKIYGVLASLNGRAEFATMIAADASMEARSMNKQEAASSNANVDVEGRVKAASVAVLNVKRYVETKSGNISVEAKAGAEARIRNAEALIVDAKADAEAGLSLEAAAKARQALQVANETKVLTQTQLRAEKKTTLNFLADPAMGGSAAATISAAGIGHVSPNTSSSDPTVAPAYPGGAGVNGSVDGSPGSVDGTTDLNLDGSTYFQSR